MHFWERFEDTELVGTLYGSHVEYRSCVGYCCFHTTFVTARQLKQKECLKKKCDRLIKKDHPFWQQREQRLQQKSLHKLHEKIKQEELYALVKQNMKTAPVEKDDIVVWGHDITDTTQFSAFLNADHPR